MNFCPKCGNPVSEEYKFCAKCGEPLNFQPNPQNEYVNPTEPIIPEPVPFENNTYNTAQEANLEQVPPEQTTPSYSDFVGCTQQDPYAQYQSAPNMASPYFVPNVPVHDNSIWESFKLAFQNYVNFKGRTRRRDYWQFVLCNMVLAFIFSFLTIPGPFLFYAASERTDALFFGTIVLPVFLNIIYSLVFMLPSITIVIRRLHDTGRSGWFWFLNLIPYVGSIVVLVFCCLDSQVGANQYGENPKGINM